MNDVVVFFKLISIKFLLKSSECSVLSRPDFMLTWASFLRYSGLFNNWTVSTSLKN